MDKGKADGSRPVHRCGNCGLNQYETSDGRCRRCKKVFHLPVPVISKEKAASVSTDKILEGMGHRIKMLRMGMGLTQSEVCKRTGSLTRSYLCRIETGFQYPSLNTCERIAEALRINVRELFIQPNLLHDSFVLEVARHTKSFSLEDKLRMISLVRQVSLQNGGKENEVQKQQGKSSARSSSGDLGTRRSARPTDSRSDSSNAVRNPA